MDVNNSSLSTAIIDNSIKKLLSNDDCQVGKVNISQLAKNCDMHLSTLWCYLNGRRKWPADHFLRVLAEIGEANVIDGHLIINIGAVPKALVTKSLNPRKKKKWVR